MSKAFDYHRLFKWLGLLAILLFLTTLVYSGFLYVDIEKSKNKGMLATEQRIYNETEFVTIEQIDRFYGAESYHIVFGTDQSSHKKVAFIPLDADVEKIVLLDESEIMSKDSIREKWAVDCQQCSHVKITPGIVDDKIIWELTYRDNLNRYVLELLSIYDGKQYERMSLTQRFK